MKYTSASANKRIKKLNEEKALYVNLELNAAFYVAAADETPVIPDFDYAANAAKIEAIDLETVRLKAGHFCPEAESASHGNDLSPQGTYDLCQDIRTQVRFGIIKDMSRGSRFDKAPEDLAVTAQRILHQCIQLAV